MRLGIRQLQQRQDGVWDAPHSFYTFSPAPGWRLICLDGYDVSILGWPAGGWKDGGVLFLGWWAVEHGTWITFGV